MSFKEKLDDASLKVFNEAAARPFAQQAVFFLDAFWHEYGDQAEYIYAVAYQFIREVDMHAKGVNYVHKYTEGVDLDFDMGLYYFEKLCKFKESSGDTQFKRNFGEWLGEHKNFKDDYKASLPEMMTSIVRKKELRDKVDVNFDGRVGFLEYLLYQYQASPKDLIERHAKQDDEPEEIRKARLALEMVNKSIMAYEAEKQRLEDESKKGGVKGLRAKNQLAQLESGPLMEKLNKDLITAEAAVRIATRKFKKSGGAGGGGSNDTGPAAGGIWWMNRDLAEKKKRYGKK
jgi:hypothetical protein